MFVGANPRGKSAGSGGESEAFTLEVLGEPTARLERRDGSCVWPWNYAMVTDMKGGAFLLTMSTNKTSLESST
ncbi:MAG: hypothetical protein OSB42_14130 [Planctomycetota bacterium]|nr:hypothetical protein [Planctomycetota bacterium]